MVAKLSNIAQFCDDLAFVIAGRRSAQNAADRRCGVDCFPPSLCDCISSIDRPEKPWALSFAAQASASLTSTRSGGVLSKKFRAAMRLLTVALRIVGFLEHHPPEDVKTLPMNPASGRVTVPR
jgi:hypothetical protein